MTSVLEYLDEGCWTLEFQSIFPQWIHSKNSLK
jgi:hypothetical protein